MTATITLTLDSPVVKCQMSYHISDPLEYLKNGQTVK